MMEMLQALESAGVELIEENGSGGWRRDSGRGRG
jgi:hypothetical protein